MFQRFGWYFIPRQTAHDGRKSMLASLPLASQALHLEHAATIGARKGVASMPGISRYIDGGVFMWRRGDGVDQVSFFPLEGQDLCNASPATILAHEVQEVNEASVSWAEVCFFQFLCVGGSDVHRVATVVPNAPLLASVGARRRQTIVSPKRPVEPDIAELARHEVAPHSVAGQEGLSIKAWFPATKVNRPIVKTPLERPSEGQITRALPNENASLINSQGAKQVASRKPVNMTFGSPGGIRSIQAAAGSFAKIKVSSDDGEAEWPGHA